MPDTGASPPQERFISKLDSLRRLTDEEKQALRSLPMTVETFAADRDIVREGDSPTKCFFILSGLACRHKILPNGRRQILTFEIPHDIPDLQSLHIHPVDHSISTLAPMRAAFIPQRNLNALAERNPGITNALWRCTTVASAISLEWITNIGRRSAHQRTAHLLCELALRFQSVGLSKPPYAFRFPITQGEFADAVGISAVHVNRVVQDLRRDGLIVWDGSQVILRDWGNLAKLGQFSPTYLHLNRE